MTDERLASLRHLEEILSYEFRDMDLLDNALIHRSFVHENPHLGLRDNERLEFLGDAVLQLCMSVLLMEKFAGYTEGQLSRLRASFVNEHSLSERAKRFSIGDYVLLGRGEELSQGRAKSSILANAFEAVTAAIFLDGGFEKTHGFVRRLFEPLIDGETMIGRFQDYKTALQEASLWRYREAPRYTLIGEYGPDHDRIFEVRLAISDLVMTTGTGRSKKEAEQQAARRALEILRRDTAGNGGP
jgi:ribonuclease-3